MLKICSLPNAGPTEFAAAYLLPRPLIRMLSLSLHQVLCHQVLLLRYRYPQGVGVGQVEASIGDADINVTSDVAHTDQDVLVRAVSDTYWTDVSGALPEAQALPVSVLVAILWCR